MVEHVIGADGAFTLEARNCDIRLRAVPGDTVRIRARDGSDLRRLDSEPGDGMLAVQARGGAPDLDIEVPVAAAIIIQGSSSDLAAIGLRGEQRYRTASGDIELHDVGGRLAIEAVSGDVDVLAAAPTEVSARTVSGDLALRAGSITRLRAVTTSGDLHIAGSFDGDGPYAIETVSGDATLAPANGMRVEVSSITGDVRADVDSRAEGPRGRRTIVVGAGGPDVTFRSTSGDLHIVRAAVLAASPVAPPPLPAPLPEIAPDHPVDESRVPSDDDAPPADAGTDAEPGDASLDILRALERGEIDVDEATRRLAAVEDEEAGHGG